MCGGGLYFERETECKQRVFSHSFLNSLWFSVTTGDVAAEENQGSERFKTTDTTSQARRLGGSNFNFFTDCFLWCLCLLPEPLSSQHSSSRTLLCSRSPAPSASGAPRWNWSRARFCGTSIWTSYTACYPWGTWRSWWSIFTFSTCTTTTLWTVSAFSHVCSEMSPGF